MKIGLLRSVDVEGSPPKDVYDAAIQGDKLALDVFETTGAILGEALADSYGYTSPEAIILFSGH